MGKHAAREKDGERMENVIFLDIDGVLNSTLWDETVSYTHLDVYKRQPLDCRLKPKSA